jgi:hypothetical protein
MSDKKVRLLHDVKSKQYLLIAKAGLAVPTHEMPIEQLWENILLQFRSHVAKFSFVGHLGGLKRGILFRRTKHLNDERDIIPIDDIHNGMTLWRKYGEIKRYIQGTISSSWDSLLGPDGNLPSGKNMEDMLLETRKLSFKKEEESKAKKSTKKGGYVMQEFCKVPNWYPLEWEIFLQYGACSNQKKLSSKSKCVSKTCHKLLPF